MATSSVKTTAGEKAAGALSRVRRAMDAVLKTTLRGVLTGSSSGQQAL